MNIVSIIKFDNYFLSLIHFVYDNTTFFFNMWFNTIRWTGADLSVAFLVSSSPLPLPFPPPPPTHGSPATWMPWGMYCGVDDMLGMPGESNSFFFAFFTYYLGLFRPRAPPSSLPCPPPPQHVFTQTKPTYTKQASFVVLNDKKKRKENI